MRRYWARSARVWRGSACSPRPAPETLARRSRGCAGHQVDRVFEPFRRLRRIRRAPADTNPSACAPSADLIGSIVADEIGEPAPRRWVRADCRAQAPRPSRRCRASSSGRNPAPLGSSAWRAPRLRLSLPTARKREREAFVRLGVAPSSPSSRAAAQAEPIGAKAAAGVRVAPPGDRARADGGMIGERDLRKARNARFADRPAAEFHASAPRRRC